MSIRGFKQFIHGIREKPENYYIIHYSCQSLNDDNEGLSPRITSIAVMHFETRQATSFSTHNIAEQLKIAKDKVPDNFDEIERKLLCQFYNFIHDKQEFLWVHWNMRDSTYGFEHIEHRYRYLSGNDAPVIPVESRINLNDMLCERYGNDYVAHPKMLNLMNLNGGKLRNFLTGQQEPEAFKKGEYAKMHKSTLSKVGFFHSVMKLMSKGKLKTEAKGFGAWIERVFESRTAKCVGAAGTICSIIGFLFIIISLF